MEDDWDLHAVVRGCASITTTSSSSSSTVTTATNTAACSVSSSGFGACYQSPAAASFGFSVFGSEQVGQVPTVSDPFEARSSIEELHELYKPFFPKSHPPSLQTSPLSPLSSFSVSSAPKAAQTQQKQQQQPGKQSHVGSATASRSKRRKNQLKKVCQVPAESLSSDIWAWRKYGQKPIKGSPYPRGYYRCSSSKGCLARKQVERNRSDPTMFIVTYTAEHNHPAPTHRNSLAGSTRQKPLTTQSGTAGDSEKPLTKPISPACSGVEEELAAQSAKSESKEEKEDLMDDEEEDEFGISDMAISDDFFEGLDEFTRSSPPPAGAGDCFIDPFSAGIALPAWVANNATTAASGS
ncbi:hypothetical protein L6164_003941 [Bauhinia variegata]|uniref:Uncharacterized protein n=1 Tax=Bauhinia variegata TaxID=167791 RepID=A0ACB9Q5K2_BAUVA|nr:hypothetical protein L6164_003941 [Bauhinia variegata]